MSAQSSSAAEIGDLNYQSSTSRNSLWAVVAVVAAVVLVVVGVLAYNSKK